MSAGTITTFDHNLAGTGEATKWVADSSTQTITYWVVGNKKGTKSVYRFGSNEEYGAAVISVASL